MSLTALRDVHRASKVSQDDVIRGAEEPGVKVNSLPISTT